jgi:hypothetical protein
LDVIIVLGGVRLIDLNRWFVGFHKRKHTASATERKSAMCTTHGNTLKTTGRSVGDRYFLTGYSGVLYCHRKQQHFHGGVSEGALTEKNNVHI